MENTSLTQRNDSFLNASNAHMEPADVRVTCKLDGSDTIKTHHLAEALQYRPRPQM
ncbi:MAG: hypothetical protein U0822_03340 [Anaerolineae bacterium]